MELFLGIVIGVAFGGILGFFCGLIAGNSGWNH